MSKLKILYLEDSPQDAEMTVRVLKKAGLQFSLKLTVNEKEYRAALSDFEPDIILSDHAMYQFDSLEALKIFKESGLSIPFILVTGTVSEEFAVTVLKAGADDYLLKDNLTRLPAAIENSVEKFRMAAERQRYLDNIIANEAMMKAAESLAGFGSWQVNMATGEIVWSEEMFRIYGYEPGALQPSYEKFLSHVHPEEVHTLKARLEQSVQEGDALECEFRIIDTGGNIKYISNRILYKRDREGRAISLLGFNQDISKRKEAEENFRLTFQELARVERELVAQQLNQQKLITETTIQAQEREREELAKELHDNINQILASAKMYLNMARDDQRSRDELISRSYQNVSTSIEEIRKLCKSLVAPTLGDVGLQEALTELVEEIRQMNRFNVELEYHGGGFEKPDANLALMLYRVTQEQMNNIVKYAKAKNVSLVYRRCPGQIFFTIKDDGVGFDASKKANGIGLKNMRSRVEFYSGRMNVISSPGKGCAIDISIPLAVPAQQESAVTSQEQ